MTGKRKGPPGVSTPSGQRLKSSSSRQELAADGPTAETMSFLRGSAYIVACFACFLLGFRLSWEGKAAFLGAYRGALDIEKPSILRYLPDPADGMTKQGGLDLRPGAWESGYGDKYGAGVADGEWERIERRILASAGKVANASREGVRRRFATRPPDAPQEHPWVGRHNISVRPWPHPDAGETLLAHALIAAVQREQQHQFGVPLDRRKRVIVVTPTYRRPFQQIHLSHLTDTLRLAPEPLSWLVVEAGGPTTETQTILSKSGLSDIHLLPVPGITMPDVRAPERPIVEDQLRDVALAYIQKTAMDGIVVFADDSSALRLALFQEVQKVRWFATFSVGMLVQGGGSQTDLPVQGPICTAKGEVRGWHAADHDLPRLKKSIKGARRALLGGTARGGERMQDVALGANLGSSEGGSREDVSSKVGVRSLLEEGGTYWEPEPFIPRLEWVGFAFNARLLWDRGERPAWLREWKPWGVPEKVDVLLGDSEDDVDPSDLLARVVEDETQVETLGRCGKDVLAWWLRVEAAEGGVYPEGWRLHEALPVVAEPREWGEEEWKQYEAKLVEEKKKKKKKGKKKKKKAPQASKAEEDAAARQAAEQAAADEARRVEEEKTRALEEEAKRAEEERRQKVEAAEVAKIEEQKQKVEDTTAEDRTALEGEIAALLESEGKAEGAKEVVRRRLTVASSLEDGTIKFQY